MPKPKSPPPEEDRAIVDETEDQTTQETAADLQEQSQRAPLHGKEASPPSSSAQEEEREAAPTEEPTPEDVPGQEAEPGAEQLASALQEVETLKAENARLRGETPPPADTSRPSVSAIQRFVSQTAPRFRQAFLDSSTPEQQFESLSQFTDHLVGAVLTDNVQPLAMRVIELGNELDMRDLRDDDTHGAIFRSAEAQLRARLAKLPWMDRSHPQIIRTLYHQILGERKTLAPADRSTPAPSPQIADRLKDLSAGTRGHPSKPAVGFKLTPEQEADFQAMVEDGFDITRERYAARYKARVDKARAEKRPAPSTLRSFR